MSSTWFLSCFVAIIWTQLLTPHLDRSTAKILVSRASQKLGYDTLEVGMSADISILLIY